MSGLRIGELFAGYGGLGMGVQSVLGGDVVWVSDVCKFDKDGNAGHYEPHRSPCSILAHRLGVPNHGDVTKIDWSSVEPIDVLTGGSPCQDLSAAGKRKGMTEGTRSNLWVAMREAIAHLRPSLVVWENVQGAGSAEADSDLVNHPRLLAGVRRRPGRPVLRALGRVVGDLSDLGYVGQVRGIRASDVGAPHGRFRYFLAAYPEGDARWFQYGDGGATADPRGVRRGARWTAGPGEADSGRTSADVAGRRDAPLTCGHTAADHALHPELFGRLLPTPRAGDGEKGGPNQRGSSGDFMLPSAVTHLLPTPAVNDMGEGKTVEAWDEWTAKMKAAHGNGNGHGASLSIEAQRLLPTPRSRDKGTDADVSSDDHAPTLHQAVTESAGLATDRPGKREIPTWGHYAAAIHRWETLTRPAPPPTETGPKGNPRLSAAFSEWMMGLPAGWITDVPGITRNEALKAAGNGVVPQQAAAALADMLAAIEVAA